MGDISTWNPVDNSNTTAPPDGWPEGMAPSAVNNCARAMMGAVRRWYDTVTAQLATFLPLSGGTLTGPLSAPQYNVSSVIFAAHSSGDGGNYIYDGGGAAALQLYPAATVYQSNSHQFRNDASAATFTIDVSGNVTSVASMLAGGSVTSNGNVTAAAGTVQAAQLTSTGNINAAGTVTAAQLTSTGNIYAAGSVAGADLYATTNLYLSGVPSLSVTTGNQLNVFTTTGQQALVIYGSPTNLNSYFNNLHSFGNVGNTITFAQFSGAGCFNVNGGWGVLSDASLKEDIAPYERGLEAILALSPVSFRYKTGTPFADPERTLRFGLVAQDVAGVVPEMVGETTLETGGAVATMFPGHLVYVLVTAAKELADQNAALAARITALEGNHV